MTPIAKSVSLTGFRPSDYALSPDGETLYVIASNGSVAVYDMDTATKLRTFDVSKGLNGLAISADGSFLIATDKNPVASDPGDVWWETRTTMAAYRIDTATGAKTTYSYTTTGSDWTLADVAILSDGNAYFTGNIFPGWSGWSTMKTLNLTTGAFDGGSTFSLYMGAEITPGQQRSAALVGNVGLSSADYYVFDPESGFIADKGPYDDDTYGGNGIQAYHETAGQGGLIAISAGGLHIYNGDLQHLVNLGAISQGLGRVAGLAFDPAGTSLYVLDGDNDSIVRFSTSDWSVLDRFTIPGNPSFMSSALTGELVVGPDAEFLLVLTTNGILRVDNPAFINGSDGTDVITGRDAPEVINGLGGNDELRGGSGDDRLNGGSADDVLAGGGGADRLEGGTGADALYGDAGDDELVGGDGADRLYGFTGADRMDGGAGDDVMLGADGADRLDGGVGADTMRGGAGDDVYAVDDVDDRVLEKAGEGYDLVESAVTFSLAPTVEALVLKGSAAIDGKGSNSANRITGNDAVNVLSGMAGDDVLVGGGGADRLVGGIGSDRLAGGAGRDVLAGGAQGDLFVFGAEELGAIRSTADRVTDFDGKAGDRIDLSAIDAVAGQPGDQAFSFVGAAAFSGQAGELRVELFRGQTFVEGDTDGDGRADFAIRLDGAPVVQATDFLL